LDKWAVFQSKIAAAPPLASLRWLIPLFIEFRCLKCQQFDRVSAHIPVQIANQVHGIF